MSKKIIVAGAGHGGMVAAYYLAKDGYDVTVYEKQKRNMLGYPQYDSVHLDGFEESGIPIPEQYRRKRTPITFCIPGSGIEPVTQGDAGNTYNVEIDRKFLYRYLIGMAEEAGAKFVFGCEISSAIILGNRIAGIKTSKGDIYGDLVIDAAGLYSPVRSSLPEFTHIQSEPGRNEVLNTYRAYFSRVKNAPEPEHKYLVSLIPGEFCGLMWVVTKEDCVDVLIGSFNRLQEEDVNKYLGLLREDNPHIGKRLVKGGKIYDIPLRQPLAVLVADGYAAVGDSAFMTIPIKGSGIGYSMRAGKILAQTVAADENGFYTAETLWNYQTQFFDSIGSTSALLAVIKCLFPKITFEDLEYIFGEKVVTSEDLEMFGNESSVMQIISSLDLGALKDKALKAVGHQNIRKILLSTGKNIAVYKLVEQGLKKSWSPAAAAKWADGYNSFFEELTDDTSEQDAEKELKQTQKLEKKKEKEQEKELKKVRKKEKEQIKKSKETEKAPSENGTEDETA